MIFSDTPSAPTSAGTSQCHRPSSHRNVASTIAAPAASAVPSGWIVLDACSTVGAVSTRTITVARASNGILKSPIRNHMHTVKIASQSAPTRRAVVTRLSDARHLLEHPADGALDRVVRRRVDVGGVVARFLEVGRAEMPRVALRQLGVQRRVDPAARFFAHRVLAELVAGRHEMAVVDLVHVVDVLQLVDRRDLGVAVHVQPDEQPAEQDERDQDPGPGLPDGGTDLDVPDVELSGVEHSGVTRTVDESLALGEGGGVPMKAPS